MNPIRYRDYYFDTDINMYYLLTRYYDPKIGRFINADTPKYLEPKTINGLNLYAYCGNNPIKNVDPTGNAWYDEMWNSLNTFAGIINPISTLIAIGALVVAAAQGKWDEIKEDAENGCLNILNQDESVANKAKVLGFYKGSTLVRQSFGGTFSILGTIWAAPNTDDNLLKHEFGHNVQERILGFPLYAVTVSIPSAINYHFGRWNFETDQTIKERMYYSKIWERTADFFGGLDRDNYDPIGDINNFLPW